MTTDLNATFHQFPSASFASGPDASALETSVLGSADTAHAPCVVALELAPPTKLGAFRIESKIGEGAEGALYRAIDERLGRAVALKVLHPRFAASKSARGRFIEEAKLAASVDCDHVVRILEVGGEESEAPYLAMELIEGAPLSELVRQHGPLPPRQAVELVRQAALGLAAVHGRQLVHRDVKSANLLFDSKSGRVKLADFGLAKVLEDELPLTADNFLTGTPAYMSPEQITTPLAVDSRSDVYALGVVLYELLTGQTPFQGAVRIVLTRILHESPAAPSQFNDLVPAGLDAICLKAMSKTPSDRFGSAGDFATTLGEWLSGPTARHSTPQAVGVAPVLRKRLSVWNWLIWMGLFGIAGMFGLVLFAIVGIAAIAAIGGAAKEREPVADRQVSHDGPKAASGEEAADESASPAAPAVAAGDAPVAPSELFSELVALQQSADEFYEKEDYAKSAELYADLRDRAARMRNDSDHTDGEMTRLAELEYEGEYGLFWAMWRKEENAKALEHGAAAEKLAAQLLKDQASPERFVRLLTVQSHQYDLQYEQKNWASAQSIASHAVEVARQFLAAKPSDLNAVEQLADRLNDLGDVEYERGRYAAAEKSYGETVALLQKQAGDLNHDLSISLVEAELGLADSLQQLGRESAAEPMLTTTKNRLSKLKSDQSFGESHAEWLKEQTEWLDSLTH